MSRTKEFRFEIPAPKISGKSSPKAYALLVFRTKAHAVSFRNRFTGANYDAGYIGVRDIEPMSRYVDSLKPLKELGDKGQVLAIRIEHGGRSSLMRAIGFIECQLFNSKSQDEIPVAFEVWNV